MGEARSRGSRGDRISQAQQGAQVRMHVLINETKSDVLILTMFPCYDCGYSVAPVPGRTDILDVPVRHSIQFGDCLHCRAQHMVLSAKTKADCIALEPVVKAMQLDGRPRIAPQLLPRSVL